MRHNVSGRKLGKKSAHRLAMFKNMASSLIEHGRIQTTLEKAKELRSIADKLVTLGKSDTVHSRRQAFSFIRNKDAVKKLFSEIAPSFEERKGGYTRIYRLGQRAGDAAKMAIIEYLSDDLLKAKVEGRVADSSKKDKKAKKTAKPAKKAADKKPAKKASAAKTDKKETKAAPKKAKAAKETKNTTKKKES
ncbi:50S ribosomal protein L17 [bacterium K02(2017)]|nr:50S ribosomal protein L17 [bacterium K02(2017)]